MDSTAYTTLSRQSGLMREMQIVANNVANASTTGYRQGGMIFSEFVRRAPGEPSISMAGAKVEHTSLSQGALRRTDGPFDMAIEGDGFFQIETPDGVRLTRAGAFSPNAAGDLVTMEGHRVLDAGGAPVFVPGTATSIRIASDGTISADDGPIGQVGVVQPVDPLGLVREDGVMFRADDGVEPAEGARVLQFFLESSNVNSVLQLARMIEVQRAYELGQKFLDAEDRRVRDAIDTLKS
ncbi:flagellar hook-basal body complex protein [Chachezhania antarctica]|uniref:flagellar hook-basal body complex protein n=1 Tax=Chachezhania antarctica TaxID=2340860 RepID=UPI000EAD533A|nr:flagellar hook-basal body complex protein [Chachezhania antarctica]|tara:strand:- start:11771 stop:12484 length:714 start_codon:yes stop_codon:yes gene_type:complete